MGTRIPACFTLRRVVSASETIDCRDYFSAAITAPIYVFPDHVAFDSDEVESLVTTPAGLALPHPDFFIEVPNPSPTPPLFITSNVAFVTTVDSSAAIAFLFIQTQQPNGLSWSEPLIAAYYDNGTWEYEPRRGASKFPDNIIECYAECLSGTVMRGLAMINFPKAANKAIAVPETHRIKSLKGAGAMGWSYRLVNVKKSDIPYESPALGGSHAAPRWHIRRGHWRTLPDRSVWVRQASIGDKERGGIIKDYMVGP